MGVVHHKTIDQTVIDEVLAKKDDRECPTSGDILNALQILRKRVRKQIEECRWGCPIHGHISTSNDCEECDDALDMNVIVNNILNIQTLQDEGLTTQ